MELRSKTDNWLQSDDPSRDLNLKVEIIVNESLVRDPFIQSTNKLVHKQYIFEDSTLLYSTDAIFLLFLYFSRTAFINDKKLKI